MAVCLVALTFVAGCAGLPRIDPSGRRILIWPSQTASASAPSLPSFSNLGNVNVPPVLAGQAPPAVPSPIPAAPAPVATPMAIASAPVAQTVQSPVDEKLRITPSRLLAPVGSEVILKAGVCSKKGYLRTNRRIEWMLGQEGTGQFVTVGEQGEMDMMRLPWQRPNKQDNSFAVGYTTPYHVCLRRGNEDASDDVQVERGEAWITLTSASEGVSYVTAKAPESKDWNARRATTTVYWVDAQWRLPQPLSLQPGQTGTLVTTVTRRSDGAPVSGWIVRYEVLSGQTARLGYESGQTSEAKTDDQGRASMQITPTDDQPGSAQVRVTVIRPANGAPMPSPRLEVGGGNVGVSWSPAAQPPFVAGPPIDRGNPGGTPVAPPRPFEPPPTGNPDDTLGQPDPGRGPVLELVLKRDTTGPLRAGEPIPVTITLLNAGDAPAQNLTLEVEYDRGLSSDKDPLGKGVLNVKPAMLYDLAPGDSNVIELEFTAVQPGRQCYRASASGDGGASAFEQQCFEIERPAAAAKPKLRIETALDPIRNVGDTLTYLATVYNDGPTAVEGVKVEVYHDAQVKPDRFTEGAVELNGHLTWTGERIEPGKPVRFEVQYECLTPTDVARITAYASYSESEYEVSNDTVEIRTRQAPPPTPAARRDVEAVITSSTNPARVGQNATLEVTIRNTTSADLNNVQYRLRFPSQLQPTNLQGGTQKGNSLEYPPIDVLRPGEPFQLLLPYMPLEQGIVAVVLETRVGAAGPVQSEEVQVSIGSR